MSNDSTAIATRVGQLANWYRTLDPAGAYARYSAYVALIAGASATAGYLLGANAAGPRLAAIGAVYAGLLPGIALMLARPGPWRHPIREIMAVGGAILVSGVLGAMFASRPAIVQPLVVVVAFCGFYVRRWPEPWPSAGLLCVITFLINQILAPYAPPAVMHAATIPAVAGFAVGYWFLPRTAFSRGLLVAARRLRAAVPIAMRADLKRADSTRETVAGINGLLVQVNKAREQADRFNGADAQRHLALVHAAAVVARVWENVAESLHRVSSSRGLLPEAAWHEAREAEGAVAHGLDETSLSTRASADAALAKLDKTISAVIAGQNSIGAALDSRDTGLFALLNVELTLSHLLDATGALDRALAGWPERSA